MKAVFGLALLVGVASSALAVTADQEGYYTGKMTFTKTDFNTKKSVKHVESAIVIIDGNGTMKATFDSFSVTGMAILGQYGGVLDAGPSSYILKLNGKSITGSHSDFQAAPPDQGMTQSIVFKVKKSTVH